MVTKSNVLSNLVWRLAERCGAQFVTLVVSVILARLLSPEDYGTVALVTVFTTILQVFVDSGFSTALIQRKNADELDFSSVFYFNFILCIILYLLMFFSSKYIAMFYGNEELVPLVRFISLTIIISGFKSVQQAYVSKNLLFKRFFYATLGGTCTSAIIGIYLAYKGFGVWAIAFQQVANNAIDTIILWVTVKWRPKLFFSWDRLQGLLGFGWRILLSSLLDSIYNNIRNLLIGKIYNPSNLAYYNQGEKFPKIIVSNINSSIDSVLLPAMSIEQDDRERIKIMTRRAIQVSTFVMAPMMVGLACCARNIVIVLLTEKWLPCVFFLQIFCFTYMLYPIHTANLNAIKAVGRSDLFLRLEIIKKIIGLFLLIISIPVGIYAIAYSLLLSTVLSAIINSWPNRKLLNYPFLDQVKDIVRPLLLSFSMGIVVVGIGKTGFSATMQLAMQIVIGLVTYIVLAKLTGSKTYLYIKTTVKEITKKS